MELQNIIVLMGPPGCGKGTQSKLLVEKLGYGYFSMGDYFREVGKQDSPLGQEIRSIIDRGMIVPDDKSEQVFREGIEKVADYPGLVIDGFPRTVGQIEMLNRYLNDHNIQNTKIFFIDVDKANLLNRLSERSQIQGRADDADLTSVEKRFDEYTTKTGPVKDNYETKGQLIHINGDQTIQAVHEEIMSKL